MDLQKLMMLFRGNQSTISKLLGVTRGTLRTDLNNGRDYRIINGVVYKSMGKARAYELKEIDRLKLEEEYNQERG